MENKFIEAGIKNSNLLSKSQLYNLIQNAIESEQKLNLLKKRKLRLRYLIAFGCITLCFTGVTVYAASSILADKLGVGIDDIHSIDKYVSNEGITMTVISSHVCEESAVVLVTFTKDKGEKFENSLNPYKQTITCNGLSIPFTGIYTELSEDSKTLYCYYTWNLTDNTEIRSIDMTIQNLICNESMIEGKTFKDDILHGNWSIKFDLVNDESYTRKVINKDVTKKVTMCGKELQINYILLTDMLLIIDTNSLNDSGIPEDLTSSISTESGSYYGVYIQLEYINGKVSEKRDCLLDSNGQIVAWFPETISIDDVDKIHVGDVVIPVQ